jgi:flagellar biosynthesis protein FliR
LSDELKPSTSLKDGRMKDEQENITQEIILYMVSIMALIAVLLFNFHHVVFVVIYNNYEIRITK